MRETELLNHIYARSARLAGPLAGGGELVVGPGDDCAVVRSPSGDLSVLTTDQLVAGVHFEPDTPIDLIARKTVARSVSDIAAMGARPTWSLATALLPRGYPHSDALFDAMARWATHWRCPLIGGDIAQHTHDDHPMTLTTTVCGQLASDAQPLLRSNARAGDRVWVSGAIGCSFESGRHLTFEPRVELGSTLQQIGVRCAIDLSDGLGRDAGRVAQASALVLEINAAVVPLNEERKNDWKHASADGEDYELLFTADPVLASDIERISKTLGVPLTCIGVCRHVEDDEPAAAILLDTTGKRHAADELGWEH